MLYLTTGANGAGKTLITLKRVQELAVKESRPVAYNGRFKLNPDGPLASWKQIDMKDWQAEPDGTIFFVDECHQDFPVRSAKEPLPQYVQMLAEHRARGFDFFLLTQHPQNIDVFVRRLIGSPGWHRHLKRTFGADLVSQLEWSAVNPQCERPGSGESGSVSMVNYPKEVYTWYTSAQLHTGKKRIPVLVWVAGGCALLAPFLGWFAYSRVTNVKPMQERISGPVPAPGATVNGASSPAMGTAVPKPVVSLDDYLKARTPRVEGFAFTAPAYDAVTQPTVAPYPAACVSGFNRRLKRLDCSCYTQQGTHMQVPSGVCQQIAENGFFMDWAQPQAQRAEPAAAVPVRSVEVVQVAQAAQVPSRSPAPSQAPSVASGGTDASGAADGSAIAAMRNHQRRW